MTRAAVGAALLLAVLLSTRPGEAHKGVTSKFTYNAEVFHIFLNRCGRCHVDGGVGPMSLLKYEDAFPWAESLRAELLLAASGDPHDFVKAAHRQLSARELDTILDWATGGTPEGDAAIRPSPVAVTRDWTRGEPNLSVSMTMPFDMPADTLDTTREFVIPVSVAQPRSVGEFDLLPGNPAIVRSATISLRSKDGQTRALGTWFPRQTPVPIGLKPAVRLEPGAEIVARIHYKKTWKFEGQAMQDRSTVGFYFAE